MKTEALKLADEIDNFYKHHNEPYFLIQLQSMIRRLVEELDKQGKPVAWVYETENVDGEPYLTDVSLKPLFGLVTRYGYKEIPLYTTPQTKPLSEKELYEVFDKCYPNNGDGDVVTLVDFARAIEERHGIK